MHFLHCCLRTSRKYAIDRVGPKMSIYLVGLDPEPYYCIIKNFDRDRYIGDRTMLHSYNCRAFDNINRISFACVFACIEAVYVMYVCTAAPSGLTMANLATNCTGGDDDSLDQMKMKRT